MRTLQLFAILLIITLCAFSCGKSDDKPVAGKGGNANLTLHLKHHGVARNLIKCKVYVKYNTKDAPANGVYDDSVVTTDPDSMQSGLFGGLKNGDYYFYGYGCDTSIYKHVYGGIPYTISSQTDQTYELPVTEDASSPCN